MQEETVLTQAIKTNKIRVVERLLELRADPNLLNRKGYVHMNYNHNILSLLLLHIQYHDS